MGAHIFWKDFPMGPMKARFFFRLGLVFGIGLVSTCLRAVSEPVTIGNLKKVLVFNKHIPIATEPYKAADSLVTYLGRLQGFSVRITDDSNMFNEDTLKQFQVVVWNNVMRNVLSLPEQQAFERYMEAGGGYLGFHAAATNRRIWPWYVDEFLGGDNHDQNSILWGTSTLYADTVQRQGHEIGVDHFIMKGIPKVIPQYGEWYNWNPNPADNPAITVLQWYKPKMIDNSWPPALPISWCRNYGSGTKKGRLFYIQVNHEDSIYVSAWYRTMVGNAFKWVAQDDATTNLGAGRITNSTLIRSSKKAEQDHIVNGQLLKPSMPRARLISVGR
jgi:type 1 glutamine amidotransferase